MLRQLRARINKLQSSLDELLSENQSYSVPSNPIPSGSLVATITSMLENPESKTRRHKVSDLKTVAKSIVFLQQHGITDLPDLRGKVTEILGRQNAASDSLKKVERRMKTLNEHLRNADNYFQHRALYKEYKQQKPNEKEAFYEHHRAELALYESAERYLKQVMNGHTTIPTKAWKVEATSLLPQKENLYADYIQLREEIRDAEVIQRCVEQVMSRNEPLQKIQKDMQPEQ